MAIPVIAYGPNSTRRFSAVRKAARALSGNGVDATERTRSAIRRKLARGGGYVGQTRVEETK